MRMRLGSRSQSAVAGLAILLFGVACTDALGPRHGDVAAPTRVTGSGLSLSLVGANIVRHKPIPGEMQTNRFVLQGERTERGSCRFHREITIKDGDAIPSEWVVESDLSTCTDILAQGHIPPGRRPAQAALGKSPAVAPNLYQDNTNYSRGEQSAGGVASTAITAEWRYQDWETVMADIDNVQFRYTLSPDCITGGNGWAGVYWNADETLTIFPGSLSAYFFGGGGPPDNSCNYMYAEHDQWWTVGYTDNWTCDYTFTPHIDTQEGLNFRPDNILYRFYTYSYENDFYNCNDAMYDFRFILDAENPPPGTVDRTPLLPSRAIP
ncbi:MAG TPA: hypothetical protein VGJ18_00080 [Gemmatimonadaceae bacterium]|jgi:hypothetical protein